MNRIIIYASILILALSNLSFRWPVNNGIITSTFGESRADHFHDGIDLVSADEAIYPVAQGKLLYLWNKALFPLDNYWGGGNYKLISHEKGEISIYMHLQDGENFLRSYSISDKLGRMGNTGHSFGSHIHLSILDPVRRESINPFAILPSFEDKTAPEILHIYLKIGKRYVRLKDKSSIRLTKHYPLLVEVKDSITGSERLGVYKFSADFNSKNAASYEFRKIGYSENGLTVKGRPFQNIMDERGYYIVSGLTFRNGLNTLKIQSDDFQGNRSEKFFTIEVELDIAE